jgi:hypothetical protein
MPLARTEAFRTFGDFVGTCGKDDPALAVPLRIEERELEAGGLN